MYDTTSLLCCLGLRLPQSASGPGRQGNIVHCCMAHTTQHPIHSMCNSSELNETLTVNTRQVCKQMTPSGSGLSAVLPNRSHPKNCLDVLPRLLALSIVWQALAAVLHACNDCEPSASFTQMRGLIIACVALVCVLYLSVNCGVGWT